MKKETVKSMRFYVAFFTLFIFLPPVPPSECATVYGAKWHDTGIEHVTFNCFVVEVHTTSWPSPWYYPHQVSKVPTDTSTTQKSARFKQLGIPSPSIIKLLTCQWHRKCFRKNSPKVHSKSSRQNSMVQNSTSTFWWLWGHYLAYSNFWWH